jgi:NitT/TauT family transport system substrate-binding protein
MIHHGTSPAARRLLISVLVLTILAAVLCVVLLTRSGEKKSSDQRQQPMREVRIGYQPIAASLPLFVAQHHKEFEKRGLAVTLTQFMDSNALALAGQTDRVDVLVACATNAALDAMASGNRPMYAFLTNGYVKGQGGRSTDFLLVRRGIDLKTLERPRIAFFPGSVSRVFMKLALTKYGLDLTKIEYLELAPPGWLPALKAGSIDAVTAIEPFATDILAQGLAEIAIDGYYSSVMTPVPLSSAWLAGNRLDHATQQNVIDAFAAALEAIDHNDVEARQILSQFTKISVSVAQKATLNKWNIVPDPVVRDSLIQFQDLLTGHIPEQKKPPFPWIWPRPQDN